MATLLFYTSLFGKEEDLAIVPPSTIMVGIKSANDPKAKQKMLVVVNVTQDRNKIIFYHAKVNGEFLPCVSTLHSSDQSISFSTMTLEYQTTKGKLKGAKVVIWEQEQNSEEKRVIFELSSDRVRQILEEISQKEK